MEAAAIYLLARICWEKAYKLRNKLFFSEQNFQSTLKKVFRYVFFCTLALKIDEWKFYPVNYSCTVVFIVWFGGFLQVKIALRK